MGSQPSYNFDQEWARLQEDMIAIRLKLSDIHNDPAVLKETIRLLSRMGEEQENLENQLEQLSKPGNGKLIKRNFYPEGENGISSL